MTQPSPSWVRQGRAMFVVLHLLAVGLAAIPAPVGGMSRRAWKQPTVQGEIQAWADRLGVDADALESGLWDVAVQFMGARKKVLRPFRPYYFRLGTQQSWRMFVAPHRHPSRLHIDVWEGADWRNIYIQTTPGDDWMEEVLEGDRFRSALFRYAWPQYERPYRHLARWLAKRAADDFPDATRLRTRWYRKTTPTPRQMRRGTGPEGRFHSAFVVEIERSP
ncbi:MAG: hypothetical protein VX000_00090 [Myxococcota bacterium]|nr:hypothetical protein [Myxococcota bacterium]